jgi:hypothetical protein
MTSKEIFELNKDQLESMAIDELLKCVEKLLSDSPVRRAIEKDGVILLDPNNPNDQEWYENDEAYDIL